MSLSISSEGQYLSRWYGIEARSLAPNIFPDPRDPLRYATMTLYEPPQELLEKYLKGGEDGLEALEEFYYKAKGVVFTISSILREMVAEKARAEKEGRPVDQTLMWVLCRHLKRRAVERSLRKFQEFPSRDDLRASVEKILDSMTPVKVRLSELVVHPFNARFVYHDRVSLKNFEFVCRDGGLKEPLLVVPVASMEDGSTRLAELHVKMFEMIQEKIRVAALSDEELRSRIERRGIGWAMRAFTGYREVMVENGRLVFTENDPLRQITGVKEPRYFIIDGQLRALAMMIRFEEGVEEKVYSRDRDDTVGVHVIDDADPLTASYLSITLNTGPREVSDEELKLFLRAVGPANKATLRMLADRVGSDVVRGVGEMDFRQPLSPRLLALKGDMWSVRGLVPEPSPPSDKEPEEEKREERGRERREESTVRPAGVPLIQRQPAQPQAPAQIPISTSAQPFREEVFRPSAPPRLELDTVIASLLRMHKDTLPWLRVPGSEVKMEFSHKLLKVGEESDKKPKGSVYAVSFNNLTVKLDWARVKASGYLLLYFINKEGKRDEEDKDLAKCPNCETPIVLSPIRCLGCGNLIDRKEILPFPYDFRYKIDID